MKCNCKAFSTVCTFLSIGACVGSIFLLSTVNPPPLPNTHTNDSQLMEEIMPIRIDADGNLLNSLTPFFRYSPQKLASVIKYIPVALVSKDSEKTTEDTLFNFPPELIRNVVPPPGSRPSTITILTTTGTTTTLTKDIKEDSYGENDTDNESVNSSENTNKTNKLEDISTNDAKVQILNSSYSPPVKGLRRSVKSIENRIFDGNASSIIMKVVGRNGQSRIEIKINPEIPSLLDRASDLVMVVEKDNKRRDIFDLGSNTEIKILPNDTVSIKNTLEIEEELNPLHESQEKIIDNATKIIENVFTPYPLVNISTSPSSLYNNETDVTTTVWTLLKTKLFNGSQENERKQINETKPDLIIMKPITNTISPHNSINYRNNFTNNYTISDVILKNQSSIELLTKNTTLLVVNNSIDWNITKYHQTHVVNSTKDDLNFTKTTATNHYATSTHKEKELLDSAPTVFKENQDYNATTNVTENREIYKLVSLISDLHTSSTEYVAKTTKEFNGTKSKISVIKEIAEEEKLLEKINTTTVESVVSLLNTSTEQHTYNRSTTTSTMSLESTKFLTSTIKSTIPTRTTFIVDIVNVTTLRTNPNSNSSNITTTLKFEPKLILNVLYTNETEVTGTPKNVTYEEIKI